MNPVEALRNRLFSEIASKTKEELRAELEEAGFVVRNDLVGSGILNPDGTPFIPQ